MSEERLDKIVSRGAGLSRAQAKDAIRRGRVTAAGKVCRLPEEKCDASETPVALDGRILDNCRLYLMMNKPAGVLTATVDPTAPTALEFLPDFLKKREPGIAGRLDKDTEGLLLITTDGLLNHRVTSPRYHVDKRYYAELDGPVGREDQRAFQAGIALKDFVCAPAELEIGGEASERCTVTVREGKYHQVKRMFHQRGREVLYLKRLSMGPIRLDPSLKPGEYRALTEKELELLFACVGLPG